MKSRCFHKYTVKIKPFLKYDQTANTYEWCIDCGALSHRQTTLKFPTTIVYLTKRKWQYPMKGTE